MFNGNMSTDTNSLLVAAENLSFFTWTWLWSQKGGNVRCVTCKWNAIFCSERPISVLPVNIPMPWNEPKDRFPFTFQYWEHHWATRRPGTRKTTSRLDHRSQSRREWIWRTRRFGWILRWLSVKKKLGNFTSVRVDLSKSELILRLQKDILGNFNSVRVDPGKSELIRPGLVRVRVQVVRFYFCTRLYFCLELRDPRRYILSSEITENRITSDRTSIKKLHWSKNNYHVSKVVRRFTTFGGSRNAVTLLVVLFIQFWIFNLVYT